MNSDFSEEDIKLIKSGVRCTFHHKLIYSSVNTNTKSTGRYPREVEWVKITCNGGIIINLVPHREDGPAIIYADGSEDWCIDGKYLDIQEVGDWLEDNEYTVPLIGEAKTFFDLKFG